ncbi:helicase-associated domain-containing protein [Ornithinimicrobium cryptoxanthini]|uniref:helicase-associated domain-containing protein n=1 Tax=Ornithinimicrobium cryptoxanthini TaxID=2934161 RepID=UPI0021199498|nr:helicase-associated domain-containing protein [Ornithinimicrobium cryptoxanthini]
MPIRARSLADDLRGRSQEDLVALLVERPDLARPTPADLTTLAARATTRASVQRALDGLDLAHLQTLEVICVLGAAPVGEIATALGEPKRSPLVAALVERLCALALCWRSPEGFRAARTVQEVVGAPAGLGPETEDAPTGQELTEALDGLDRRQRAILDALTWGPPVGVLPSGGSGDAAMREAGEHLLGQRLLRRTDESHVLLPRQVALRLRGGRVHRQAELAPPAWTDPALDADLVDATAGGRAAQLLEQAAELLDEWGTRPPRVLRTGGLAVRDLARAATLLEATTAEAAWLIEVLHAAGLIAADESADPSWMPTGESDDWAELTAGERWAALATAWHGMAAGPSVVGSPDGTGKVNALSTQTSWPFGRQRRHDVLAALATLPAGSSPTTDFLVDLLRWRHPIRMSRSTDPGIDVVLREADWAGLTGRGALATAAHGILTGDVAAAGQRMDSHIPEAVEHVLVQADLTAVAPGRLDGPARSVMRLLGQVESRGGATVHRITESGIRRALDLGWSADRVLSEVSAVSRTGVPQPLDYLVRDVARRHGVARVGSVGSYVRSDDPALLDRVLADRTLGMLQLRRIAPTVLVSPVPAGTVLDVLRERQYGPVPEGEDGGLTMVSLQDHRATRRPVAPTRVRTVDAETAARIVATMVSGESSRPAGGNGLPAPTDPVVTSSLLREAAAERLPVWIGYADEVGGIQRLLLRPTAVEQGRVRGTVADQDTPRSFLLHRISGVAAAD